MVSSVNSSGNSLQSYWAQQLQNTRMQKQMFSKLDTNGDESLNTDELDQLAANSPSGGPSAADFLKQMDTDGDGSVSESEFESSAPPSPPGGMSGMSSSDFVQQLLKQMDTDGDGSVSESEFSSILNQDTTSATAADSNTESATISSADLIEQMFNTMDTNSDESISSDELSEYVANSSPPPPPPPDSSAQSSSGASSIDDFLSEIDTDRDGTISSSEFSTFFTDLKAQNTANDTATGTGGTESQVNNIASMFSSAMQSYMQLSCNGFSQMDTQSLLGSALYV